MNQQDHTRRRLKPPENTLQPQQQQQQPPHQQQVPPQQQPQKCPRCESVNTKFCYYNNYSLSQPRYFCKTCRRYWTQGGTLRNVPVGGGCRKGKRAKPSSSSSGEISRSLPPPPSEGQTFSVLPMTLGNNLGLPPVNLTATPNYYTGGGGFLSSLAAMQSLSRPQGFNQQANNTGVANNLGLLQGLNFHSFRPQIQQESEMYHLGINRDKNIEEGALYSSHQNFVQPNRPLGSWTQSFINNTTNNVSAASNSSTLWNNTNSTSGSSLNPNQWPHDLP